MNAPAGIGGPVTRRTVLGTLELAGSLVKTPDGATIPRSNGLPDGLPGAALPELPAAE